MSADSDSEDSSIDGPLDLHRDDGWKDLAPDIESQQIFCLFCPVISGDVPAFLSHCQQTHSFNFLRVRDAFDLDFIGTVKLVNYLRSHGQSDTLTSENGPLKSMPFEDDKYLKPVLQDDALIYNLDELPSKNAIADGVSTSEPSESDLANQVRELQAQLEHVKTGFAEYRLLAERSLREKWNLTDGGSPTSSERIYSQDASPINERVSKKPSELKGYEDEYFDSYSHYAIHELMLKDAIRTDAYRDFIYDNKHLFTNKVVLDVGCGTGILSMFAARAGAKQVIAVDNSSILGRAQENIFENNLQDTIKCLRGKIEDIHLPVRQVDIIISEWMGYCLLFEAMLDSVLWARDRYLAPDGLMVPSHAALRIAPFADDDLIASHLDFWKDVYGFSMNSLRRHATNDVLIRTMPLDTVIGDSPVFLSLDLRTCSTSDLTFPARPFSSTINPPTTSLLAGFIVSFDICFLPYPSPSNFTNTTPASHANDSTIPPSQSVSAFKQQGNGHVAFTTGPEGPPTHWQQGVLLLKEPREVKKGEIVRGTVGYEKREGEARGLDVRVRWRVEGMDGNGDGVSGGSHGGEGGSKEDEVDVGGRKEKEKEQLWSL